MVHPEPERSPPLTGPLDNAKLPTSSPWNFPNFLNYAYRIHGYYQSHSQLAAIYPNVFISVLLHLGLELVLAWIWAALTGCNTVDAQETA